MSPTRVKTNILLILTDDQGAWALGCAGNGEIRTPNLDRLAREGMRFDNFFCTSPVCSPARASLLTGKIPSQHGIHDWIRHGDVPVEWGERGPVIRYLADTTGYTDILAARGYTCGISGKWHLGDALHAHMGFSFWRVHAQGAGPYYGAPLIKHGRIVREPRYVTDAITENALAFLKTQRNSDAPFYLSVHYTAPHSPWDRANHPAELYDEYFDNCPFQSVPVEPMHPRQINTAPYGEGQKRRELLSGYFAALTAMDSGVGRILEELETMGARDSTLVFFTGDNGMNMGHHGIYGKGNGTFPQNMYDTSVKVPAIFWLPGRVPEGVICRDLLSHYDFLPTLLDFLAVDNPLEEQLPGRSFAPLLRGKTLGQKPVVVFDEYGPVRMIRSERWKYVHRHPYGPHELFDLKEDPEERSNLYGEAGNAKRVAELKGELDSWFHRYTDPALDGSHEAVTGKGQLGLAGPAGRGQKVWADDWHYLGERPSKKPSVVDY